MRNWNTYFGAGLSQSLCWNSEGILYWVIMFEGLENCIILLNEYAIMGWFHIINSPRCNDISNFCNMILKVNMWVILMAILTTIIIKQNVSCEPIRIIQGDIQVNWWHIHIHFYISQLSHLSSIKALRRFDLFFIRFNHVEFGTIRIIWFWMVVVCWNI